MSCMPPPPERAGKTAIGVAVLTETDDGGGERIWLAYYIYADNVTELLSFAAVPGYEAVSAEHVEELRHLPWVDQ